MGKKGKGNKMEGNAGTVIRDVQWGNVDDEGDNELIKELELTKNETAVGFESADVLKDNWEEDEDELLKQRLRIQNGFPSLSNINQNKEEESKNDDELTKQQEKEEKAKKKEERRLKKELKEMDLKLKESKNWSFSPVIPIYRQGEIRKYNCIISAYDLASYFENSIIRFIPSIQRGSVIGSSGKEKDNFSNKHVMDIFKAFTENRIHGNTIVLNYSLDNESELVYDPDKNSISGEGYLQGIDFSHRARAAIKWKSAWIKHPDQYEDPRQFQFVCEVNNITDNDARQMFSEYNNFSLKVNKTRVSYLDNSNFSNQIARRISLESDWKNKIETVSTNIKSSSPNICTFGVLTNAIKRSYETPQTKLEQKNIEDWLIEYIDQLVSILPQFMANPDIESRNNLKKKYFTIEPLAIGAMIALSAVLKDDPDWKVKLAKLMEDDFFLRTADRFKPILRNENKVINTSTSAKYFDSLVIDWCTK